MNEIMRYFEAEKMLKDMRQGRRLTGNFHKCPNNWCALENEDCCTGYVAEYLGQPFSKTNGHGYCILKKEREL